MNVCRGNGIDRLAAEGGENVFLEAVLPLLEAAVTPPARLMGDQRRCSIDSLGYWHHAPRDAGEDLPSGWSLSDAVYFTFVTGLTIS